MEEDLRTLLVTAASGATIAWGVLPQGSSLPAIRLNVASETTDYTYGGEVRLRTSRVQADIFAASYGAAVAVDRAVAGALSGYRGIVGDTEFLGIFLESRFGGAEGGDQERDAGSAPVHHIERDLMVSHKEV